MMLPCAFHLRVKRCPVHGLAKEALCIHCGGNGAGEVGSSSSTGCCGIVVVLVVLVSLWRGMQAQERIARHLEGIERALSQRPLS